MTIMQQENGYKKYLTNEYNILKKIKKRYTLKVILKDVLKDLGYESLSENEVILHNLSSLFENQKGLFNTIDDVVLFEKLGIEGLEEQRKQYYNYISNFLKNNAIYSENVTEATMTFKSISFDNQEKEYTKSQLFRCINKIGNTIDSPSSAVLSRVDYTYNKKSKETKCDYLNMNVCLVNKNNQKIFNTYSMVKSDVYNSNYRMVECSKKDRLNRFFKYDIENLLDIIPTENEYFDLEIIRDNGNSALFIKQNDNLDITREIPITYDIEETNFYKGNKFTYGNETLRNLYHKLENKPLKISNLNQLKVDEMYINNMISKEDIILNNDEDLFTRVYKFSDNDMIDLTKSITKEELSCKKLKKNIK